MCRKHEYALCTKQTTKLLLSRLKEVNVKSRIEMEDLMNKLFPTAMTKLSVDTKKPQIDETENDNGRRVITDNGYQATNDKVPQRNHHLNPNLLAQSTNHAF